MKVAASRSAPRKLSPQEQRHAPRRRAEDDREEHEGLEPLAGARAPDDVGKGHGYLPVTAAVADSTGAVPDSIVATSDGIGATPEPRNSR